MKIYKPLIYSLLLFFIVVYLYFTILYPSYLSLVSVCLPNGHQLIQDKGYIVVGTTSVNETGQININIILNNSNVIKHELIHVSQIKRGYPGLSCTTPMSKFLSEIEAKTMENLPDKIFYKIYKY